MRKNRFDPKDPIHQAVRENPAAYTRESRRAAGLRVGAHAAAMREFYSANRPLPRSIRRLFRDPDKAEARVNRNRAKIDRVMSRLGFVDA